MSSLGIFNKETKTYQKVADLSKTAVIDSSMSDTSTNAVQNKVVKKYVDDHTVAVDSEMSSTSANPVQNKVVKSYVDGLTSSVAWNSITGKPNTYPPSSHTHTKSQITDFPSSLPANGGNSDTVNGHTVNSNVPANAKFTDTTYGDATTSAHGLMTPAMVTKLNGIAEGANRTTVDAAMSSTSANPVQNKVIKSYVDNGLNSLKKSVSDGKTKVANAITAKGVTTATDATFATMANNISQIETGVDTSDATATAAQILTGQTAYVNGSKITGTMANRGEVSQALNAGGSYTIPSGYHNGSGKVTANSLASQTSATATAAQILSGQTAWVNGNKLTGTMSAGYKYVTGSSSVSALTPTGSGIPTGITSITPILVIVRLTPVKDLEEILYNTIFTYYNDSTKYQYVNERGRGVFNEEVVITNKHLSVLDPSQYIRTKASYNPDTGIIKLGPSYLYAGSDCYVYWHIIYQ